VVHVIIAAAGRRRDIWLARRTRSTVAGERAERQSADAGEDAVEKVRGGAYR